MIPSYSFGPFQLSVEFRVAVDWHNKLLRAIISSFRRSSQVFVGFEVRGEQDIFVFALFLFTVCLMFSSMRIMYSSVEIRAS